MARSFSAAVVSKGPIRLIGLMVLSSGLLSACGSSQVFSQVSSASVALIPRDGEAGAPTVVTPAALPRWGTCLEGARPIPIGEAYKAVLSEGEYRLQIADRHGARTFTLHNATDFTDVAANFYRSDCLYDLVRAALAP